MREGSLDPPVRHPLDWRDEAFYDTAALDTELRRVFDICHGCRRCFNLCDSFPRLFDLIDAAKTGELDSVDSADFEAVVEACTLCDLCFMTKCPYVPPHEFGLDFPHLMLRYRAVNARRGKVGFADRQLARTDRNGRFAAPVAGLVNWANETSNALTRPLLETVAGVDRRAHLPKFHAKTFARIARDAPPTVNTEAPAHGRKAVLYATCFANYNEPDIGRATQAVLAKNGVATDVVYPECCGMPQLEQGELSAVVEKAKSIATALAPYVEAGHDIIALVPSCALMLKFEWPLLLPDDGAVKLLAGATFDISEYVVDIARREGLADGLAALDGGITLHIACHARAQNMGRKAEDMLKLIPDAGIDTIERCSGHGGAWGVKKENFEVALKIGRPVARQAVAKGNAYVASECPLAGAHILQGMERQADGTAPPARAHHPIELFARAYGLRLDPI